jgi:hypothetical protein
MLLREPLLILRLSSVIAATAGTLAATVSDRRSANAANEGRLDKW